MSNWEELEKKYMMGMPKRVPGIYVKGKGARLINEEGQEYLDFVAGWAVDSLGHCHPEVVKALTEQVQQLIQTSNQFYTVPQIKLAELLAKNSCLNKTFFCNSGAEAAEGAVKLARRYGKINLKGAYEVITAINSFHGRTLAMTAATGQLKFQQPYQPVPVGFPNVEFNNIDALKAATTDKTCAVMLEPIQAEGGVNMPDDDYLKKVRAWCDEKGILMILDEIQTGIGRTGTLFAYEQYGVEPDIMALAKGLGSGFPIGAIMAKDKAAVFVPGEHGSTFGGNPMACSVGYTVVKYIIDHDVSGNAKKVGDHFMSGLKKLKQKYPFVTDVRGRGLLLAMEFKENIAESLMLTCLRNGLLVNQLKLNALRFIPPLIVTNKDVDQALAILDNSLAIVAKGEDKKPAHLL